MPRIYGPGPEEAEPLRPVPDLGGMPVDDVEARPVGEVFGSLIEAENGLIRYLDVAVPRAGRHVLVPLGHARIEEHVDGRRIRLRAARREELESIPPYAAGEKPPDGGYQERLLAAHGRLFHGERYYAHPSYDHAHLFAGEHPIVHADEAAPNEAAPNEAAPLTPLAELPEMRVAEGEPDIRGWPLVTGDGEHAADIRELIVDADARKVRYAVVAAADLTTLLPVGFLDIDTGARRVRAPALTAAELRRLPRLGPDRLTRQAETRLREALEVVLRGERRFLRPDFRVPPGLPERADGP